MQLEIGDPEKSGIEIRRSPIHGMGLYALRAFRPGEIVLRWDLSQLIANDELSSLPERERQYIHPFDEHRTLVVQPPERYLNHSCNNNTVVRRFCDVAIRVIEPDEEITSDYSADGSNSGFICSCRAENCRKIIRRD